jgi:general secretion pathway protein E
MSTPASSASSSASSASVTGPLSSSVLNALKPVDLDQVKIDPTWALRVPASLALRRQVLPFAALDGRVYVACADINDKVALEAVERFTGCPTVATLADRDALQRALARVYGSGSGVRRSAVIQTRPGGQMGAMNEGEPDDAVATVDEILRAAILRQASDVHVDPSRDDLRVRLRVDGKLEEYRRLPSSLQSPLTSRIKVLAKMDIAEKRAPQDGSMTHRFGSEATQTVDIRVASLPTKYGERLTLRLLGSQSRRYSLEALGMDTEDLACMEQVLAQPHGLVLLTGPTGSGKSTTLYAGLQRLIAGASLNVITVEDPIEYEVPGVAQVEVDSADKVSFSKALRSILRHDPDVLMIGEIRDMDTLDVAVKASLTGHLVLSTLHTNSAASAVTRLADMGLERYLISATMRLSAAQRLVRKLCAQCRAPRELTLAEARTLGDTGAAGSTVYEAKGCIYCAGRGFSGRLGLFELMLMNPALSELTNRGGSEGDLCAAMKECGVETLLDDGRAKVLAGLTTVQEVVEAVAAY